MKPILYPDNETDFYTQGIGVLSDAISAHAITEINSTYEIDLIYPMDGVHFADIHEGSMILAPHDDTGTLEPYEVYAISAPMNGKVVINAWHNSYKLNGITCEPFSGTTLASSLVAFKAAAMSPCPFEFTTSRSVASTMAMTVPMPMRSVMGGVQGSFLDRYGGEWDFSGWNCDLKSRIGQDTDVVIKYAKNLLDAKKTTTINNLWTGIVPYWDGEEGTTYYNSVIYTPFAQQMHREFTIPVDCSQDFETMPTQQQMFDWGTTYIQNNARTAIPTSIDVSFVALWQTDEYKNYASLQRLTLGDGITVYHPDLGIDVSARIVRTEYDILADKYSKMTIGSVQSNIAQSVQSTVQEAVRSVPSKDWFNQRLLESTALITGGLGGYIVMNRNADGQPEELIIMDQPSIETAVNCIRINKNGIGFSQNGYNGPFNSAWTINGELDMQQIAVLNLSAAQMTTGRITDATGRNYWDLDTGEISITATYTDIGIGARNYIRQSNTLTFEGYYWVFGFFVNGEQFVVNGENLEVNT